MHPFAFQHRIDQRNPIAPYSWQADYTPTGRLRQFDVDGPHTSLEIDRARVRALVILGHPDSPIHIPVPFTDGRVPDEVIVKAQVSVEHAIGLGNGDKHESRYVHVYFGYRYGAEKFLVEIDPAGRIFKTNSDTGEERP